MVMAFNPALAAAYGMMLGLGRIAPPLLTLMIEPLRPDAMRVPINEVSRNGPRRFTSPELS